MEELVKKISEILSRGKSGIIALQNNPSIDGIAAATALYLALVKNGKTLSIVSTSKPQMEMAATDKIQQSFAASGNHLVISFPYSEGAIDKVDYNINGNNFNLIIIPNSETQKIDPKDVKFSYTGGKIDFIITVDVPNLNSLGAIYTENQSDFQSKSIINIDRHLINNNFGTVNVVNKSASATSEIVYNIIKGMNIPIDKDIATNLYTGIMAATNNFTSFSVTPITFEVTADLMKLGAEKKELPQQAQRPSQFAPPAPAFGSPQQGYGAPTQTPFGYTPPQRQAPVMNAPVMNAPMQQPSYPVQQPVRSPNMNQMPAQGVQQQQRNPMPQHNMQSPRPQQMPPMQRPVSSPQMYQQQNQPMQPPMGMQQPMGQPMQPGMPNQQPQGYTRRMTQNPYLENQRPQQPYNSYQRPQQQNQYRPEPQQQMPHANPMPHQLRQQGQYNQPQRPVAGPQAYPQQQNQPMQEPMNQPAPQIQRPQVQPMPQQRPPQQMQQMPSPQPPREPQHDPEIPQPISDNNPIQPSYPSEDNAPENLPPQGQNQQQQPPQQRSPQDWLKPKLFRGNNLL